MARAEFATPRRALVAGASGLVGQALLHRLLASPDYVEVHALVRRLPLDDDPHPKLQVHPVDFTHLSALPAVDDVFIALGTTIKQAGSQEAFRRVDFEAVVGTARAAHAAGARRLLVVSALGADADSRVFYNRVKGEMEHAVTSLGYATVVLAQPSLLLGDREALGQPSRAGEAWAIGLFKPVLKWLPAGVRPIPADTVAAALVASALQSPPGVTVLKSARMQQRRPPNPT